MADEEDISQQMILLTAYRRSLALYLEQLAQLGPTFATPGLLHSIADARDNIRHIKSNLHKKGVAVEDFLIDEKTYGENSPIIQPTQPGSPQPVPVAASIPGSPEPPILPPVNDIARKKRGQIIAISSILGISLVPCVFLSGLVQLLAITDRDTNGVLSLVVIVLSLSISIWLYYKLKK
jgi:hypothetical protein